MKINNMIDCKNTYRELFKSMFVQIYERYKSQPITKDTIYHIRGELDDLLGYFGLSDVEWGIDLEDNTFKITPLKISDKIVFEWLFDQPYDISNDKEYLLCSAIKRLKPSTCHRGYKEEFHDIYDVELGWRHPDILHKFEGIVSKSPKDQGFFTSKGRFVNREEAEVIAKECGQVIKLIGGILTSEDLY